MINNSDKLQLGFRRLKDILENECNPEPVALLKHHKHEFTETDRQNLNGFIHWLEKNWLPQLDVHYFIQFKEKIHMYWKHQMNSYEGESQIPLTPNSTPRVFVDFISTERCTGFDIAIHYDAVLDTKSRIGSEHRIVRLPFRYIAKEHRPGVLMQCPDWNNFLDQVLLGTEEFSPQAVFYGANNDRDAQLDSSNSNPSNVIEINALDSKKQA